MKAELDLKFLLRCRDAAVYPTIVKWKMLRKMKPKERTRYHARNLKQSITEMSEKLRNLKKESETIDANLKNSLTWMKYNVFKISIKRLINNEQEKVKERHDKKFDKLIVEKALKDDTKKNPNNLITNLTEEVLSKEETDVLMYGLNHGIALRPREEDILPVIEGFYSKIKDLNAIKKNYMASERIKYALRSFAYNVIDIDDKHFHQDNKRVKVMKSLRKRFVILKPDKGQGVVLLTKEDYVRSMENIFSDRSKFKEMTEDPTIRRVETIKSYLNTMLSRGEITEAEKKIMRRKGANRARARGLPKTHKTFDRIPPFRPIIDTTNTPYSGIGNFLKSLLYPMTINEYSMKDTFHAVDEIKKMDFSLLNEGYRLVSFDVVSLFTNVPLRRTIDVIVNRIYKDKVFETKLRKSTLKKLILDCCTKTTFSFNDKLYEQIDGVCMGSSLGPVLANVIMTELEKIVLPKLIEEGFIKHYIRYVDDTLVMVKDDKIGEILEKFNSFDKNLRFTVDTFDDGDVHFLDIRVHPSGETDVYSKPTNTGQYSHFDSYAPWGHKISWARALFDRAFRICSNSDLFHSQKTRIGKILSWNGFPSYVRKKLMGQFCEAAQRKKDHPPTITTTDEEIDHLSLKIPYMGANGEKLVKTLKRKIQSNLSRKVNIRIIYTTSKLSKLCSVKDKIPEDQKNNVIYSILCPGCGETYVGKTNCCFRKRMEEQGAKPDQPMYQHLRSCEDFQYLVGLMNLPSTTKRTNIRADIDSHIYEAVKEHSRVLATSDDWLTLAFLEPLIAKKQNAKLNNGEKAMKTLCLF